MNKFALKARILYVLAFLFLSSGIAYSQTQNCQSILPWTNYNVYQQGYQAKYNGTLYQAKWYSSNQTPGDPNGPWLAVGTCSDNVTVIGNCYLLANWNSATVYTQGQQVVYNGSIFTTRQYTQNQTPGTVYGPWDLSGICDPETLPGTTAINDWHLKGNKLIDGSEFLGSTNNFPLVFKSNNVETARISENGSMGIGTGINYNQYYHKLTVNGLTNIIGGQNALQIASPTLSANGTRHFIYFSNLTFPNSTTQYSDIGAYEYLEPSGTIQGGKHIILQAANASNLGIGYFASAPTAKLAINGTVSIGADSYVPTGFALSVNGKMIATEVRVFSRSKWPDYVFDKEYKLRNLRELETYIKENKHLPDVPSAIEVDDCGISLGEMDGVLLKKIEELTIYSIEQQKLIDQQKEMNEKLMKLLQDQNARIEKLENK